MKTAFAGGPDFDVRQEQQQMILQKAYDNAPDTENTKTMTVPGVFQEHETHASTQVPNPDLFDKVYVLIRSVFPDWMIILFIVVGASTVGLVCFRKQVSNLIEMWSEFLKWKQK